MIPGWLDCVACGREYLGEARWSIIVVEPGVIRGACPPCAGGWLRRTN